MIRKFFRRGRHRPGPTRMSVDAVIRRVAFDLQLAASGIAHYQDDYSPTGWRATA